MQPRSRAFFDLLILLTVPLFAFLGLLIEMTGMGRAMVGFLTSRWGYVRGGLSYVLMGAMYLGSGISGSKEADMAAVAPALFPEMKERGAKPSDLVALLAATSAFARAHLHRFDHWRVHRMLQGVIVGLTLGALVWWRYRHEDLSGVRQVSTIDIVYSVLGGLFRYRQFDWRCVYQMLVETAAPRASPRG